MKDRTVFSSRLRMPFIGLLAALMLPLLVLFLIAVEQNSAGEVAAGGNGTPSYLPLLAQ